MDLVEFSGLPRQLAPYFSNSFGWRGRPQDCHLWLDLRWNLFALGDDYDLLQHGTSHVKLLCKAEKTSRNFPSGYFKWLDRRDTDHFLSQPGEVPDDVLLHVFQFLEPGDLQRIVFRVCRHWRGLIWDLPEENRKAKTQIKFERLFQRSSLSSQVLGRLARYNRRYNRDLTHSRFLVYDI